MTRMQNSNLNILVYQPHTPLAWHTHSDPIHEKFAVAAAPAQPLILLVRLKS